MAVAETVAIALAVTATATVSMAVAVAPRTCSRVASPSGSPENARHSRSVAWASVFSSPGVMRNRGAGGTTSGSGAVGVVPFDA
jgi:hypothetical protein